MANNPTVFPPTQALVIGDNAVNLAGTGLPLHGIRVQNNTAAPIYLAYDTPALQGHVVVPAGALFQDNSDNSQGVLVSVLHIYSTVSTTFINGTVPGGLTVWATAVIGGE